ncbi:heavy metal translocating P-type ATPase [Aliikangiella maris]|uniref:Heavy metal translocating P-type ATPase n=2 Tax=Aliikangiella maris TaxID=3162458 RepID=A0ABV3MIT4_9GAMM
MSNLCFHCDLKVPKNSEFKSTILGEQRSFCCPGCLAIAETIIENGLEKFYQFRTERNVRPEEILPEEILELESLDNPEILQEVVSNTENNYQEIELGIDGITCAACSWLIKNQINKRNDVVDIQVNTTTSRARLRFNKDTPISPILKNIRDLGYRAFPFTEDQQEKQIQQEDRAYVRRLIVAGIGMMQVMMYATGIYVGDFQDMSPEHAYFLHAVSGLMATPVVFYSAFPFFKSAWNSLKHFHFGMNLPVSIAIIASYSASVYSLIAHANVFYFDSAVMFIFFLLIGRFLEHKMRLKAILKQQNFKRLIPLSVIRQTKKGETEIIATNKVQAGDKLIINSGAIIPIDGINLEQEVEINESVITGEFLPIIKGYHEPLYSGSTNNGGSFVMQATTELQNCRVQKLVQLQHNSEHLTSREVTLADKVANWYIIGLLILCTLSGIAWWIIAPQKVFPIVLSLLVVSCPCALSLATPAAVAAAIARLTDRGLMIKDKYTLANLAKISHIFFDKTGTLTLGRMSLVNTINYNQDNDIDCLQIAATLESISNHPIAHAFKNNSLSPLPTTALKEIISGGIEGQIHGQLFRIGKREFVCQNTHLQLNSIPEKYLKNQTCIPVYLCTPQQHLATFLVSDQSNLSAKNIVKQLKKLKVNASIMSGDSTLACKQIANQLGFSHFIANTSPEKKLQHIQAAQQKHEQIMMIGDGVNDIGALSQAEVGVTLGAASHLSKTASNAVLASQDLSVISESIKVARRLNQVIRQNISWAILYNFIAIPFAIAGLVPAWLAAIGMAASSLIVVLNALRLRH